MKICYFGDFDPEYPRNRVIIKGLRENGVDVFLCNERARGFKKYFSLIKKHRSVGNYDLMIIGYSDSRLPVFLGSFLNKGKLLTWDAFYSLYGSLVFDRELTTPKSLKALYYWFLDWFSCRLTDKVLLDTNEHIKYFVRTFKVNPSKFIRSFVGTDDSVFYPRKEVKKDNKFTVHFHGKFIPLQGTEYIVRAAFLLKGEDITFQIIGQGQDYDKVKKLADDLDLKNINWIDKVKYEELPDLMDKANVCLGIFGSTLKTKLVIPNKVYEAVAMEKPLISGDTPAIRELFTDRNDILLAKTADPSDLVQKIIELKNDESLRNKVAEGGYQLFNKYANSKTIGKNLLQYFNL